MFYLHAILYAVYMLADAIVHASFMSCYAIVYAVLCVMCMLFCRLFMCYLHANLYGWYVVWVLCCMLFIWYWDVLLHYYYVICIVLSILFICYLDICMLFVCYVGVLFNCLLLLKGIPKSDSLRSSAMPGSTLLNRALEPEKERQCFKMIGPPFLLIRKLFKMIGCPKQGAFKRIWSHLKAPQTKKNKTDTS